MACAEGSADLWLRLFSVAEDTGGCGRSFAPLRLVIIGPAGSGKSTLGAALAAALGWPFVEGDDFHTPANRRTMATGMALGESDRASFLAAFAEAISGHQQAVGACSALKRAHRGVITRICPAVHFLYPRVEAAVLAGRLSARQGHFASLSLLPSQLALFEEPAPEEPASLLPGTLPVEELVQLLIGRIRRLPVQPVSRGSNHDAA